MIRRMKERWHRKRIRAIYKMLDWLVSITYPIPAGMAVAIIGTCSRYHRTGMTDVCAALDWLMTEGKVTKETGDGLLPDRFYER